MKGKNIHLDDPWAANCGRAPLLRGYGAFTRESLKAELSVSHNVPQHNKSVFGAETLG